MSKNRDQSKIIQKSLYLSRINPVQQICVYLRSSAVKFLLNFIQLTVSLNHCNRNHYTKPLKLQNATALTHDSTNIIKNMQMELKSIVTKLGV
jgi:hypothetical protein